MSVYNDFRDLTTKPEGDDFITIKVEEDTSRIALCTLSAINLGNIKSLDDIEGWMNNAVKGLDNLLDYQDYMHPAAREATLDYRPLGVGVVNLAYYLAKNGLKYNDPEAWQLMHETMEAIEFYGIKASIDLAKKKGPCRLYERTKFAQGLLPIDHYNKNVDEIVKPVYNLDWEWLREELKEHGIRNATITACMPAECQSLSNKMMLKDGSSVTLEYILRDLGNIDIDTIQKNALIGERFVFDKPIELYSSTAHECYYNGPREITEIEFEDGSTYKFTNNHKLLVNRGDKESFIMVEDMVVGDVVKPYVVKNIQRNIGVEHTWDVSTDTETYTLDNGCISHNTSAKLVNATNGVEPVRSLVTTKGNKSNTSRQVVPEINRLKNKYDMLWEMESQEGIIKTMAVIQKFTCQSISTNLSYNPENFEGGKIPMSVLLRDLLLCNKYGIKTLYYHNTRDGRDDEMLEETEVKSSETVLPETMIEDDEECDSCTI